jgi:hypothetical protein
MEKYTKINPEVNMFDQKWRKSLQKYGKKKLQNGNKKPQSQKEARLSE